MKFTGALLMVLLFTASVMRAGEIHGTITDGNKPVGAGTKVEISVAGKTYTAETDKFGSYRIVVKEKGKGKFMIHLDDQTPSISLVSYDRSMRYDWILETKDSTLSLRRK